MQKPEVQLPTKVTLKISVMILHRSQESVVK
jgi:hypothetical protein